MTVKISPAIERYYAAKNRHDIEAASLCFALDAEVVDEGHIYKGRTAILDWIKATTAKYAVTAEPLSEEADDDGTLTVTANVSGNFPGSPAVLTYKFGISSDGLIERLSIG